MVNKGKNELRLLCLLLPSVFVCPFACCLLLPLTNSGCCLALYGVHSGPNLSRFPRSWLVFAHAFSGGPPARPAWPALSRGEQRPRSFSFGTNVGTPRQERGKKEQKPAKDSQNPPKARPLFVLCCGYAGIGSLRGSRQAPEVSVIQVPHSVYISHAVCGETDHAVVSLSLYLCSLVDWARRRRAAGHALWRG